MIGYKAFIENNGTYHTKHGDTSLEYEIGKEYSMEGDLKMCDNGYHVCYDPINTRKYYDLENTIVFKITVEGSTIITEGNKSCTHKYKLLERLNGNININNNILYWKDGKLHRLDGPAIIYANGDQEWYVEGKRHRLDGPALIRANRDQVWWVEGKRHRLDGPAIARANEYQAWYFEGKRHRLDGPAVIRADEFQAWYVDGELHRLDGPAVIYSDGTKEWYVEGKLQK